jgi:hypothetical protein
MRIIILTVVLSGSITVLPVTYILEGFFPSFKRFSLDKSVGAKLYFATIPTA